MQSVIFAVDGISDDRYYLCDKWPLRPLPSMIFEVNAIEQSMIVAVDAIVALPSR